MDFQASDTGAAGGGGDGSGSAGAADLIGGGSGGGAAGGADGGAGGNASGGAGDSGSGGAGGAGAGGDSGSDPDWYQTLSADPVDGDKPSLRDWVKSTGVKDVEALAKVARDNQAALRESGRIKLPGEGATAEEVAAYRKAIGVPDDAKGYAIAAPKDADGKAVPINQPLIDRLAAKAVEAGIPKGAFETVVADFMAAQMEEMATHDGDLQAAAKRYVDENWKGEDRNRKLQAVDNAARALDLSRDDLLALRSAWGPGKALEKLAQLGAGISEDTLLTGGSRPRFGMNGREAQQRMDAIKADPAKAQRVGVPGSAENIEWNRLVEIVGAEANRRQASGE